MIRKELSIGRWRVVFMFATEAYDEDEQILSIMYDMDASYDTLQRANHIMESGNLNTGFTYGNRDTRRALVVVGPTDSGREFINTLVHECYHLAVMIADSIGVDLRGEAPAYLIGDTATEVVDAICHLGCRE